MREFNYCRAHRELIQPLFDGISPEIKALLDQTIAISDKLKQNSSLTVNFPKEHPELLDAFLAVDPEQLARAANIIYFWGHWAHTPAATIHYGNMPPERIEAGDWAVFEPQRMVKKRLEQLDEYFGRDCEVKVVYHKAGPDNEATVGAYWKFKYLVEEVVRLRKDREGVWPKAVEHLDGLNSQSLKKFHDHKPGTDYSDDELPELLNLELPGWLQVHKVTKANYKPHIPMIGRKAMAAASSTGIIGGNCPCDQPGCLLTLDQHRYDHIVVLRPKRNAKASEIEAVLTAEPFKALMDTHKLDGVVFLKTEFEVVKDLATTTTEE